MTDHDEIEPRKLATARGWLADPPPSIPDWVVHHIKRTP